MRIAHLVFSLSTFTIHVDKINILSCLCFYHPDQGTFFCIEALCKPVKMQKRTLKNKVGRTSLLTSLFCALCARKILVI